MNEDDGRPSSDDVADAPFLPPVARPDPPGSRAVDEAADKDDHRRWRTHPAPCGPPTVPRALAPPPASTTDFDPRAMLEAQKTFHVDPAYGDLPTGGAASRKATEHLRREARRKRRRTTLLRLFVALVVAAGIAAAGWFAYQAYQDDQNEGDEPATLIGEDAIGPAVAVPRIG